MGQLEGKIAIVTGAASGIGKAVCEDFLAQGARVFATDIDADSLLSAFPRQEHVSTQALNVTDEAGWDDVIAACIAAFGVPNVLVNNAGIVDMAPIAEKTLEDWKRVIDVNLDGVFLGCRAGMRAMAQEGDGTANGGGSIINISSVHGMVAAGASAAYVASKGGVRLLSKQAAVEGAPLGVRVNSVHPGYIETPLLEGGMQELEAMGEDRVAAVEQITAMHPLGRLGKADEVAKCVTFLASDAASFVTGSELVVDGGYLAR